jgi:ParB family chromosome partitioning protein
MNSALIQIDVDLLRPNSYQPRRHFDQQKLEKLANSMNEHNLIQPIIARKTGDNYEIIAGERRWRAAQLACQHKVPVLVRTASNEEAALAAITENIEREELNPIELAHAFQRLKDSFALTHREIGHAFSVSDKSISHTLRLLTLPAAIQNEIEQGKLTLGHGKAILAAPNENHMQLMRSTIKNNWSVRRLEKEVKGLLSPSCGIKQKQQTKDPEITRLEEIMGAQLGTDVKVHYASSKKGAGSITLPFSSLEQFDGLLEKLSIELQ